jgi:DNA-binding MarR family transcriptional regulator
VADELSTAVYAIARGSRVLEGRLADMTLPQLRVLRLVARAPERASAIAEQAAVSRPSLTGVLDGLESRGWIRRTEVSGDRRGVSLEVTPTGLVALAAEEEGLTSHLGTVLDTLSPTERKAALAGLAALSTAMERWAEVRKAEAKVGR